MKKILKFTGFKSIMYAAMLIMLLISMSFSGTAYAVDFFYTFAVMGFIVFCVVVCESYSNFLDTLFKKLMYRFATLKGQLIAISCINSKNNTTHYAPSNKQKDIRKGFINRNLRIRWGYNSYYGIAEYTMSGT